MIFLLTCVPVVYLCFVPTARVLLCNISFIHTFISSTLLFQIGHRTLKRANDYELWELRNSTSLQYEPLHSQAAVTTPSYVPRRQ